MADEPEPFLAGDLVLLSTEEIDPAIQPPKFVGPYRIDERLSDTTFRVRVPGSMGMAGVFRLRSLIRFSSKRDPSRETTPSSGVVNSASLGGTTPIQEKKNKKEKKKLLIIGDNLDGPRHHEQEQQQQASKQASTEFDRQVSAGTIERSQQDSRPKGRKLRKKSAPDTAAGENKGDEGEAPRAMETSLSRENASNWRSEEEQAPCQLSGSCSPSRRRLKRLRKVAERENSRDNSRNTIKKEAGDGAQALEPKSHNHALKAEEAQCSTDPSRKGAEERDSSGAPADQTTGRRTGKDDQGKQAMKLKAEEEEKEKEGAVVIVDGELEWEVESILADRAAPEGRRGREFLVKWKGYSVEEATWEPRSNLTHATLLLREFVRKKKKSAAIGVRDS